MGKSIKLLSAAVAIALLSSNASYATNGMFMIGAGAKARSMGGVGITMNHDVFTTTANPATMSRIEGNRFDIGADIFVVNAESTMGVGDNKRTEKSKTDFMTIAEGVYMMPALGATWNDGGDLSYGFTMVPVGGGGSRYTYNLYNCANSTPDTSPICDDELGVNLMVMNINPTVALKVDEQNSIGATLIIGIQVFNASGLSQFTQFTTTQDSTAKLTDQGEDYAYGAGVRVGWLGHFMQDSLAVGVSYTSQTYMSRFKKYTDLFAEQGRLNTPSNFGVGISYKFNKDLTVAMDVNYIMYSDVKAISNPGPEPRSSTPFPVDRETNALGRDKGLGFGWSNQTVLKLGVIYEYNPTWTLRAGWNYGKSPIDESTDILFSMVAPAVTQNHLTMGATYDMGSDMELSFSYVHAFEFEQSGPTYINSEASYKMSQDSLGASFGMRF